MIISDDRTCTRLIIYSFLRSQSSNEEVGELIFSCYLKKKPQNNQSCFLEITPYFSCDVKITKVAFSAESGFCVRSTCLIPAAISLIHTSSFSSSVLFILLFSISSFCIIEASGHLGSCWLSYSCYFCSFRHFCQPSLVNLTVTFMQSDLLRKNLLQAELNSNPNIRYQRMLCKKQNELF